MSNRLTRAAVKVRDQLQRKPYEDDDFITWLVHGLPGLLDPGNVHSMEQAIRQLPSDATVLEIGAFCGLSTNALGYLLRKHGRSNRLVTVDPWTFSVWEQEGTIAASDITWSEFRDFIRSSFQRNVAFFSRANPPQAAGMSSDELFEHWAAGDVVTDVEGQPLHLGGPIAFAYIDGNHEYEFCKRDFENVDRYLDAGGWILFDDSSDDDPFGLSQLMREVRANPRYELVARNPNYLFRKR